MERSIAGRSLTIETGKMARQADGAALVSYGATVVLVTAVARPGRAELDFFPLTVEYKEKQYAAGKFPGGVFKREGRPTPKEILTMRMTDRPIRPLFPEDFVEEVQIITTVLSADGDNDPDVLSMIGANAALAISDIPFLGPVGSCRVGLIDDQFVVNPTHEQREKSELELIVCGKADTIVMVEGSANVIPEEDVLTAIGVAQDENVQVLEMIGELVAQCGKPKKTYTPRALADPELVRSAYGAQFAEASRTPDKLERGAALKAVVKEAVEALCNPDDKNAPTLAQIRRAFQKLEGIVVREQITGEGVRSDGRRPEDLRKIDCEVAVLPRTHGSALFTRGETQACVITTLGTVGDEQRVLDPLIETENRKFLLHYNFLPSCVGEVRPIRGASRREIGHGDLAERALYAVRPDRDDFPYTVRIVSEILESNGSSSMASVCGGTLSMMDAGVPIKDPVAGVSIGLIMEDGKEILLTDISGTEDH
ncbi:MAG: polyribonucleotide nucleotidyltransferase, partial [Candidatus Brocadiia bacterium]|nr:polyribonucleotide nucleotidyltransferase [Candidatus Brocadiia bacterium]